MEAGPHRAGTSTNAEIAETHISVIFFIGDRAYKMKKPIAFPFADFRTRAARATACHREVELNRRLAPDVYLGVADVSDENGHACDSLVVMRRMPDDRRLARLVTDGDPRAVDALDALARQLASFHAGAERSPVIDRCATPAAIGALWEENFDELRNFSATIIDLEDLERAESLVYAFIADRRELFLDRIAEREVCDGHGDLQADDVFCLDDGVRVLDCIEFCDTFRYGDVASDIAFLAMDLERLGAPQLATLFIESYGVASGRTVPPDLLHFYIAYRAQVRAKVACLRAAQHDPDTAEHRASIATAQALLALCVRHLEATRPRLVIVGGLPGTGKSTVASALGADLNALVIRSDVVRKELAGLDPMAPAGAAFQTGIYTPERTEQVYRAMCDTAGAALATGTSVVLDASFADPDQRHRARLVGEEHRVAVHELRCTLDAATARARMQERLDRGGDPSDATAAVAGSMATTFAPWPEATEISTAGPPAEVARQARTIIRTAASGQHCSRTGPEPGVSAPPMR